MKFLSWMQSKLQGKVKSHNKASNYHSSPSSSKLPADDHEQQPEEISPSLPLGLLAIGTFGNNELGVIKTDDVENAVVIDDRSLTKDPDKDYYSLEDVSKLENELRELLEQNSQLGVGEVQEEIFDDFDNRSEEDHVRKKIGLVIGGWNGDNKNIDDQKSNRKSVVKRSLSFLVKKIFVCRSGFSPLPPMPVPNFTDAPQDATMKKILKMMLQKKIYPKNSSQMASLKRFIKDKEMRDQRNEDK